jgi:hypothetical protein
MHGDVFDTLAVDIYLTIVFQTFQILLAGHRPDV